MDSVVSPGCIISGGQVEFSVLSPHVRVMKNATVAESVVLHGVHIGDNAVVQRAILDKNVVVPAGAKVGVDHEADLARGYSVSDGGITVVGKGVVVTSS